MWCFIMLNFKRGQIDSIKRFKANFFLGGPQVQIFFSLLEAKASL